MVGAESDESNESEGLKIARLDSTGHRNTPDKLDIVLEAVRW